MSYEQVKQHLARAARLVDAGDLPAADEQVRAAATAGATPRDLSLRLGPERMRALRDWARAQ